MADGIAARLDDFGGGYSSCPGSAATPTATPTPPGGLLRVVVGPSESATGAETPTPTSTPMPWTVTPTPTAMPTETPTPTPTSVAHGAGKVLARLAQQGAGPSVCAKYGITSQNCTATTYYNFGSQRVAMRVQRDVNTTGTVYWLHGDHLGSASLTTDVTGGKVSEMRFKPWGEVRWSSDTMPTDRQFTGMTMTSYGTISFPAREYSLLLGRFLSADSIVPRPGDPQSFNRYSFVRNSPMSRVDPTGHEDKTDQCGYAGVGCSQSYYDVLAKTPYVDGVIKWAANNHVGSNGFSAIDRRVLLAAGAGEWAGVGSAEDHSTEFAFQLALLISGGRLLAKGAVWAYGFLEGVIQQAGVKFASACLQISACGPLLLKALESGSANAGSGITNGDFERTYRTAGGNVQILANAKIEGAILHLEDIAIYPEQGAKVEAGVTGMLKVLSVAADELRANGFSTLHITAVRYSGANPNTTRDIWIDLATMTLKR